MSKLATRRFQKQAPLFAALGDETRITLLTRLGSVESLSISGLAEGLPLTRQAIRKHLVVLEEVGLVRGVKRGRETLFRVEPKPVRDLKHLLDEVSVQWDQALARLKNFVEK